MPPPLIGGGIKRCFCLTCLLHTSGLSQEQRGLRRPKLAEIAHVTRDSDTTFKVKRSPGCFTQRSLNAQGGCSGEGGNVFGVGNHCYVAVGSEALGASAPTEAGEGRGISWRPSAYSLCQCDSLSKSQLCNANINSKIHKKNSFTISLMSNKSKQLTNSECAIN